jgi:hypothetical protein
MSTSSQEPTPHQAVDLESLDEKNGRLGPHSPELPPDLAVLNALAVGPEKKSRKATEDRPLDPWERYRVLEDILEGQSDLAQMADRKTRFALLIMGTLNAVNLVIVTRPNLFPGEKTLTGVSLGLYVVSYAALSIYFFVQAIEALRPRARALLEPVQSLGQDADGLPGLRFIGNAVAMTAEQYHDAWRRIEVADVTREMALHVQLLARVNTEKYRALDRVFAGLIALTIFTSVLITAIVVLSFWF